MNLTPSFAGVGDLAFFEIIDNLPITNVVGRIKKQGLVRMLPPFDRINFYLSLQEWFPGFNPIVLEAKKSSDYMILEEKRPKGFEKKVMSLIHSDGEILLENSLRITSLPGILQYEQIRSSSVDVTYFASSEKGQEKFLEQIREELPGAGYKLKRERWEDYKYDADSGREFKATDCRDYRFVGEIEHANPFELMNFLGNFSPCGLEYGPVRLLGANKKEITTVPKEIF